MVDAELRYVLLRLHFCGWFGLLRFPSIKCRSFRDFESVTLPNFLACLFNPRFLSSNESRLLLCLFVDDRGSCRFCTCHFLPRPCQKREAFKNVQKSSSTFDYKLARYFISRPSGSTRIEMRERLPQKILARTGAGGAN